MTTGAKRTYGAGAVTRLPSGAWFLRYKPSWSTKRLTKTVEAPNERTARRLLSDWVEELDGQQGPTVLVSIETLITLHIADMNLNNCEPRNIADTERRSRKHLGKFFAKRDFTEPIRKAEIKTYKTTRLAAGAAPGTINRELAWLHRCLVLGVEDELINVAVHAFDKFDESPFIRTGVIDEEGYYKLLRNLPPHAQAVWCIAYRTGIRKGEVLKFQTTWLLPHIKKAEPYRDSGFRLFGQTHHKERQTVRHSALASGDAQHD